jgi:hypothetical protein
MKYLINYLLDANTTKNPYPSGILRMTDRASHSECSKPRHIRRLLSRCSNSAVEIQSFRQNTAPHPRESGTAWGAPRPSSDLAHFSGFVLEMPATTSIFRPNHVVHHIFFVPILSHRCGEVGSSCLIITMHIAFCSVSYLLTVRWVMIASALVEKTHSYAISP